MMKNNENHRPSEEVIESNKEEGSSGSVETIITSNSYDKLAIGVMEMDKEG